MYFFTRGYGGHHFLSSYIHDSGFHFGMHSFLIMRSMVESYFPQLVFLSLRLQQQHSLQKEFTQELSMLQFQRPDIKVKKMGYASSNQRALQQSIDRFGNIEIRTEKCIHVNAACTLNARVKSVAATSRTSLGFF